MLGPPAYIIYHGGVPGSLGTTISGAPPTTLFLGREGITGSSPAVPREGDNATADKLYKDVTFPIAEPVNELVACLMSSNRGV